jgi:hypothetical protein
MSSHGVVVINCFRTVASVQILAWSEFLVRFPVVAASFSHTTVAPAHAQVTICAKKSVWVEWTGLFTICADGLKKLTRWVQRTRVSE